MTPSTAPSPLWDKLRYGAGHEGGDSRARCAPHLMRSWENFRTRDVLLERISHENEIHSGVQYQPFSLLVITHLYLRFCLPLSSTQIFQTQSQMSANPEICTESFQDDLGDRSDFVGRVLQRQHGLGFHISIDGPKWHDDVDLPMIEIRTEAFRTNYHSPGWRMYTDEHQKRLDNDALNAADEISRELEELLREHVVEHRKTWKQGQMGVLTGYCCEPHLRQLRSHLAGSIAQYNERLSRDSSSAHTRIGLKTFCHGGTYILDTRPSSAASSTRNRPWPSAYPCEYELMTGPDPYRCSLKSFLGDAWSEIPFAEEVQAGSLVLQLNTAGDKIKSSRWVDNSGTIQAGPKVTAQLSLLFPFSRAYIGMLEEERSGGYRRRRSITDAVNRLRAKEVGTAGKLFGNLVVEVQQDQTNPS
jgi:hypothetical protein